MYLELTPFDTIKDLQNLIIDAIPGFEFPRKNLFDYTINVVEIPESQIIADDFIIEFIVNEEEEQIPMVLVDRSYFNIELSSEEINILAIIMKQSWVQRQVTSIENTRMKYSGADFKMTSQANHLSKLLSLLSESQRESLHMQRLYKRRKLTSNGYESNWSSLMENSVLGGNNTIIKPSEKPDSPEDNPDSSNEIVYDGGTI